MTIQEITGETQEENIMVDRNRPKKSFAPHLNEYQNKLSYFTIDNKEQEKYRVGVCHLYQRFIKTIDTRKTDSELNLELENLITLHLELQAAKEGFR